MKAKYIIDTTHGFVTQSYGFSGEYPDAKQFDSAGAARYFLGNVKNGMKIGAVVVKNYGLNTQEDMPV